MSIIEKLANESFQSRIEFGYKNYKDVVQNFKYDAVEISSKLDKITFLNILLKKVNDKYEEHLPNCKNPESCSLNFDYESIIYFLQQELSTLGVNINEDTFTKEEKNRAESLLEKVLKEIEELKLGHQIIYDDLTMEIEELKSMYFLGKKKWHQMLAGKFVDMTLSGVISETVSKQLINFIKPNLSHLLNQ